MIFKILKVSSAALCLIPAKGASSGDPHLDSALPGDEAEGLHVDPTPHPPFVKNHSLPVIIEEGYVEPPDLRTDEYYQKQKEEQERRKKERELRSFSESSIKESNSATDESTSCSDDTHISETVAVPKADTCSTVSEHAVVDNAAKPDNSSTSTDTDTPKTANKLRNPEAGAADKAEAESDNQNTEAASEANVEATSEADIKATKKDTTDTICYTESEWTDRTNHNWSKDGTWFILAIIGSLFYFTYGGVMSHECQWMYKNAYDFGAVLPAVGMVIALCVLAPFFYRRVVKKCEVETASKKKNEWLSYSTMFCYLGTTASITNWIFFGLCDRNPAHNGWDADLGKQVVSDYRDVNLRMTASMEDHAENWDPANLDPGVTTAIITFSIFAIALITLLIIKCRAFKNQKYC